MLDLCYTTLHKSAETIMRRRNNVYRYSLLLALCPECLNRCIRDRQEAQWTIPTGVRELARRTDRSCPRSVWS